jgi:competence protein ComEC
VLAWVNGWLAAYLAACARLSGGLPYAAVSARAARSSARSFSAQPISPLVGRPTGGRTPRSPSRRRSSPEAGAFIGSSVPPPPTGLRITFLDVGQGDGALIQVPGGAVLVDEGHARGEDGGAARHLGVTSLSVLVMTHPQRDHVGGRRTC